MTGSTKLTARRILLAACLGVVAASAPATAQAHSLHLPPVPAGLEAPEGHRAFLLQHAYGTQSYICLAAGQPWVFIGPQAVLLDHGARQTLTHFLSPNPLEAGVARPTWLHSEDSSAVWAQAIQTSSDPAFVQPGAIPWLLLRVVGAYQGPTGGRRISRTTFIQRVNTVGGIAPAGACSSVGVRVFVPYETDYIFFRAE